MPSIENLVEELRKVGAKPGDVQIPGTLYDQIVEDAEKDLRDENE